jgi:hypothetical protein
MVVLGRRVKHARKQKKGPLGGERTDLAMQQSHVACAPARGRARADLQNGAALAVASEIVDKGPTATPSLTILIGVVEQSHE